MKCIVKIPKNQKFTEIKDNKDKFIFFRIVDTLHDDKFLLQCINTRTTFKATIFEIVCDLDILYGLHPIQACYIGMEYATSIQRKAPFTSNTTCYPKLDNYPCYRYGQYRLILQYRNKNIGFIDIKTGHQFSMAPRDIALSIELIKEFDAIQAFYIGFEAGLKINKTTNKSSSQNKLTHLRVVK